MTNETIQVFIASFADEKEAARVVKDVRAMDKHGTIDLIDAAVIVRKRDGKVTIDETADPSGKRWAKRGAIAGGLVGLIFPPAIIGTAIAGAAGGGIWGKIRDKGFRDDDLRAVGAGMVPGSSAIIVVAEDRMIQRLEEDLAGYRTLARHAVSAEAAAAITAELKDEQAQS